MQTDNSNKTSKSNDINSACQNLDSKNIDKTNNTKKNLDTNINQNTDIESNLECELTTKTSISNPKDYNTTNTINKTPTTQNIETQKEDSKNGKISKLAYAANDLSLGISMIVAVLLGLGIGYGLYKWLGYYWLIWVGLGYGIAAAFLNVVKAYKRLHKELDSIKHEEKYKYMQDRILEKREKEAMQRKEKKNTES